MNKLAVLKACTLFRGFTEAGVEMIASVALERRFPRGVPLFVENMVGDSLIILSDGQVKLSAKNKGGEEVPLGELGPGDYLGELSLIRQAQRMCTATAVIDANALEIRHADFQKLMAKKPQACMKLLLAIVSHFGQKVTDNRDNFRSLLTKS
jgi:CRP-like cAMP-binding protein